MHLHGVDHRILAFQVTFSHSILEIVRAFVVHDPPSVFDIVVFGLWVQGSYGRNGDELSIGYCGVI